MDRWTQPISVLSRTRQGKEMVCYSTGDAYGRRCCPKLEGEGTDVPLYPSSVLTRVSTDLGWSDGWWCPVVSHVCVSESIVLGESGAGIGDSAVLSN